jgi:hypothetical protein
MRGSGRPVLWPELLGAAMRNHRALFVLTSFILFSLQLPCVRNDDLVESNMKETVELIEDSCQATEANRKSTRVEVEGGKVQKRP